MQEHLSRALTLLHGAFVFIVKALGEAWLWARGNRKFSIPLALVLILAVGAAAFFLGTGPKKDETDSRREVSLLSVADVSSGEPVTVIGEIRSVSEASVAPDSSGRVTGVYRAIGDYVSAGAVIAEIENASQKAAVAQAEAALDRAKSGSTISGISVETAVRNAETARQSAYAAITDAVTRKADATFSNPNGAAPLFFISLSDSQLKNTLESERLAMGVILKRQDAARNAILSRSELLAELDRTAAETEDVRKFLSHLVAALSGAIATGSVTEAQISAYEADSSAALASVTALQGSLTAAQANIRTAEEALTQGRSGESADVALAQASLDAAKAVLEKTIVRAPISGTISSITLEKGNFAAGGMPAVRIVNVAGLEAVAYLSERDLPRISAGASARISGSADGRVTRIAPALDPVTKKAEVRIAILKTDANANRFVAGQSATIEITPVRRDNDTAVYIPISAVKITPDGAVVFIVSKSESDSTSGVLVSVPITVGTLAGEKVEITSGLTLDSVIVEDARGLKDGQSVIIKE